MPNNMGDERGTTTKKNHPETVFSTIHTGFSFYITMTDPHRHPLPNPDLFSLTTHGKFYLHSDYLANDGARTGLNNYLNLPIIHSVVIQGGGGGWYGGIPE